MTGAGNATTATGRLDATRAPWLGQQAFRDLAEALALPGARLAVTGGAVRDSLTGLCPAPDDLDMVTSWDVETAARLADRAAMRVDAHPMMPDVLFLDLPGDLGEARHGSLRCLGSADPEAFVRDALSRDFTANAVLCAPDGGLEDHVGGIADASARRLRFVSEDAVAADPVRLVRYFRLRVKLGEAEPDQDALRTVSRNVGKVLGANTFRLAREFAMLLEFLPVEDVLPALRLMERTGLLRVMLPEADLARIGRYLEGPRALGWIDPFEAMAVLGAAGSPILRWGDWRDERVEMKAAALARAGKGAPDGVHENRATPFGEEAEDKEPGERAPFGGP